MIISPFWENNRKEYKSAIVILYMDIDLEQFGLTKNESIVYLFLLKNGSSTTGPIIKETNISNSRVYESLNSLISKGLIIYMIIKDSKSFEAVSPEKFLEIESERKKKLDLIIPRLINMQSNKKQTETKSVIYEGFEGFKTAFKKIIDDCPVNGTICILGFSKQEYANDSLRVFIKNMNLKSALKKQKLNIIIDSDQENSFSKDRYKEKFTEVKSMPPGYISPAAIDIFEDYVYIFLWEEKPYVIMIKNKQIADSFTKYFDFLWKIAK